VLADEPTGSLDEENAELVADLLCSSIRLNAAALLFATHDPKIASRADRILYVRQGTLECVDQRVAAAP